MSSEEISLEETIGGLRRSNAQGITLSDAGDFNRAALVFGSALLNYEKAENSGLPIPVDWHAVLTAGLVYAESQQGKDRRSLLSRLEAALGKIYLNHVQNSSLSLSETHFGIARLLKEAALVMRYAPVEPVVADLEKVSNVLEEAIHEYTYALKNKYGNELFDESEINNRLLRTTGICATVDVHLAEAEAPDEFEAYAKNAIKLANRELSGRRNRGEVDGFALQNAYHTVGVAYTLFAKDEENYQKARDALEKAQSITSHPSAAMVSSVVELRLAWLEYVHEPSNREVIGTHLERALTVMNEDGTRWSAAVKNLLHSKIGHLAEHLGGKYPSLCQEMYSD